MTCGRLCACGCLITCVRVCVCVCVCNIRSVCAVHSYMARERHVHVWHCVGSVGQVSTVVWVWRACIRVGARAARPTVLSCAIPDTRHATERDSVHATRRAPRARPAGRAAPQRGETSRRQSTRGAGAHGPPHALFFRELQIHASTRLTTPPAHFTYSSQDSGGESPQSGSGD